MINAPSGCGAVNSIQIYPTVDGRVQVQFLAWVCSQIKTLMADKIYYDEQTKEYVYEPEKADEQTETETQTNTSNKQ